MYCVVSMRIEVRYMKQGPENRLKYNESKTVKATLFWARLWNGIYLPLSHDLMASHKTKEQGRQIPTFA